MVSDPLDNLLPELLGDDEEWATAWDTVLEGKQTLDAEGDERRGNEQRQVESARIWLEEPGESLDAQTSWGGRVGDWSGTAEIQRMLQSGTDNRPAPLVEIPVTSPAFHDIARQATTIPANFVERCRNGSLALVVDDGEVSFVDRK